MHIIERAFHDHVVYWAPGVSNGDGTYTYDSPTRIVGRSYKKTIKIVKGDEIVIQSQHRFATATKMEMGGWLLLIDPKVPIDPDQLELPPNQIEGARQIATAPVSETVDRRFQYWEVIL